MGYEEWGMGIGKCEELRSVRNVKSVLRSAIW